jgi:uncharacterized protein YndB with AHSA1/START domain
MPNTVRLHRVLATTPEKVYRAFLEADALAKWLPPNGFACTGRAKAIRSVANMSSSLRTNAYGTRINSTIPTCPAIFR